jgi:hypothetical protein
MRASWRSWFWNIVLMIIMIVMAGIVTMVAFTQNNLAVAIGFGIFGAVCWVGVIRAPLIGVTATPRGIISRGFTSTTTIPWEEVEGITAGTPVSGMAATLGAAGVTVVRRRPDGEVTNISLDGLGSYGLIRPTPADRAGAGLNAQWANWRYQHGVSHEPMR